MTDSSSPPPRSRWDLRIILLLGVALGLLFFPRLAPPHGRWWGAAWDSLHVPGFFLITWSLGRLLACSALPIGKRVTYAAAGGFIIAFGSEWIQGFLGRSPEWGDILRDLIGVSFAAVAMIFWSGWGKRGRTGFVIAVFVTLLLLFVPAVRISRAVSQQQSFFPDLGSFDHPSSLAVWRPQGNAKAWLEKEKPALKVHLGPGNFGGVYLRPATPDWRGHEALNLEIENPGDAFILGLRIDDVLTTTTPGRTRYNGEYEIKPGKVAIHLPLSEIESGPKGRPLDLSQIRRLVLFTGMETGERVFVINSAFLN